MFGLAVVLFFDISRRSFSNIIEDGRRSRRSRESMKPEPTKGTELPSDVSGEELSGSSAHEEDGDEYEAPSVDSE